MNSQPDVRSRRVASRKPRLTASISGQRTPWSVADAGRDPALAGEVLRIGERREAVAEDVGERVGVAGLGRRAGGRGPRRRAGDRRRSALARAVIGLRVGAITSARPTVGPDRPPVRLRRWLAATRRGGTGSAPGAPPCARRRRRRRSRSRVARSSPVAGSTIRPAVSMIRRRTRGDPALGADRHAEPDRALEIDVHPGRQAPVVGRRQGPGHDLVEDRADDPAVGDPVPALEAVGQGQLRPAAVAVDVEVEVDPVLVERAAREAAVGRDLDRQAAAGR